MPDITVPVPDDRTAEFYQFFGRWLSGSLGALTEGFTDPSSDPSQDARAAWKGDASEAGDAELLWRRMTARARGMFNLLMEEPGRKLTGTEIADAVGIPNGSSGVAGVLAWPGRYCWNMNRHLPTQWREGEDGGQSVYWITPEVAELFAAARAKVED